MLPNTAQKHLPQNLKELSGNYPDANSRNFAAPSTITANKLKPSDCINTGSEISSSTALVLDLDRFKKIVTTIQQGNKAIKTEEIKKLLCFPGLIHHYSDKNTGRIVLAQGEKFDYPHEYGTTKKLAAADYDVIMVPKGYFKNKEKKFDVFLCRNHIFFESELKCIMTTNPDTVGKRIKAGSEQSSRLILDIASNIQRKSLIDGLKLGCERNAGLIEILLFFNSRFYRLPKTQILSRKIFEVLK